MTYDRRAIMLKAWIIARRFAGNGEPLHQRLARGLRSAWEDAKTAAHVAATVAQHEAEKAARLAAQTIEALRQIVAFMKNADRLGWDGMEELQEVEAELARREAAACVRYGFQKLGCAARAR